MKQFKNIRAILLIILGFILTSTYIYLRFFKDKASLPLFFIYINNDTIYINYFMFIMICIIIIIFIAALIHTILNILQKSLEITPKFFTSFFGKFLIIIIESLQHLIAFLMQLNSNSYDYMKKLIIIFLTYFEKNYLFLIGLYYGVYAISCGIFTYEIFIKFQLEWFYKSLYLYLIPLSLKLWYYLMSDWSSNKDQIKNYIEIKYLKESKRFVLKPYNDDIFKNKDPKHIQYWLTFFGNELSFYFKVDDFLHEYKRYELNVKNSILLIIYSIYLFGWIYVLYVNYSQIF